MSEKKSMRDEVRREAKEALEAMRKDLQQLSKDLVTASKTLKTSTEKFVQDTGAGEASQNIQEVPYKTVRLHREKAQGDRIGLSPFPGLDTSRGSGGARPRRGKRFFRLK